MKKVIEMNEPDLKNMEIIREFFKAKYPHLLEMFKYDSEVVNWALAMIAVRIKRGEIE